ncbi:MAG: DMT family transporter [Saprospiraceae bacterium]|nr:DMT family transporter [Saprospiraceae bacterium]
MTKSVLVKAHIYLWIVALIYGANYSIARIILSPGLIDPNGFILLRIFSGFILFRIFFGPMIKIDKKDWIDLIILSITGVLINQLFFFNGLARTSPIHASLIMLTTPILVLLFSSLSKPRLLNGMHWLGTLLGFGGATLLIFYSTLNKDGISTVVGDLMIFINAVSYAIYLSRLPSIMKSYPVMEIIKWIFLIAFFLCIPFGFMDIEQIRWQSFEAQHVFSILFVLIGTTFLAYLCNAKAMEYSNPSLVGNYIYLQPLLAIMIACIIGQDQLHFHIIVSSLIIFNGLFIISNAGRG